MIQKSAKAFDLVNDGDSSVHVFLEEFSGPEINLKRLLKKCEEMAKDSNVDHNWRFAKYVEALDDLLTTFKASLETVKRKDAAAARIVDYQFRVEFLKRQSHPDLSGEADHRHLLFERIERKSESESKSDISCSPVKSLLDPIIFDANPSDRLIKKPLDTCKRLSGTNVSSEISVSDMREELLHQPKKDLDIVLAAEQKRQERFTAEMISLVKTMKENSKITGQLVKKDFKVIDKATALADRNVARLNTEAAKLAEQNKRNTSWWILLALFVLFGVFVMIVLFIRIFPKPRHREL